MSSARLPLAISCEGGTRAARLAHAVTMALGDLGVAEPGKDVDQASAAARVGRPLIALDGCSSACRARLLDAMELPPRAALNLAELGVDAEALPTADPRRLAAEAAAQVGARSTTTRIPPRPAPPEPSPQPKRAHTADDYLLAISHLASTPAECGALTTDAPTLAAHVSRLLGVSRAAAGEMLERLRSSRLIERSARRQLLLSAAGRVAADRALRRQRLLECFAGDYLGYPPSECYEQARLLAAAFDEGATEQLRRALGDPERCPHGWPIDPEQAREESRELVALSALGDGERATVVCLVEHHPALLTRLHRHGLGPGAKLRVDQRRSDGAVTVRVAGGARRLERDAATAVFVRA